MSPVLTREQRQLRRTRVFLKGQLHSAAGFEVVRVRDISRSGALLEVMNAPAADSTVHFKFENISVDARVVWRKGSWCGIHFEQMLSTDPIEASRAGLQVSAPRTYRSDQPQLPPEAI